eukprot:CAMPEP_0178670112 /NCGR_PEP_ID=MMETSP0698-20121128/32483_1 /TAXON_ID=265572 /ORGANISM="Extubocellulus spinifer, Strain CCMP396" /LENGTH=212 /DNA_ID=CAMNT_0020313811 /DNA_START=167 /DNA_END=802 /DNA_ORIENTATION=+
MLGALPPSSTTSFPRFLLPLLLLTRPRPIPPLVLLQSLQGDRLLFDVINVGRRPSKRNNELEQPHLDDVGGKYPMPTVGMSVSDELSTAAVASWIRCIEGIESRAATAAAGMAAWVDNVPNQHRNRVQLEPLKGQHYQEGGGGDQSELNVTEDGSEHLLGLRAKMNEMLPSLDGQNLFDNSTRTSSRCRASPEYPGEMSSSQVVPPAPATYS